MFAAMNEARIIGLPGLDATLDVPFPERLVQMHFVRENGEWFAVEYDPMQRRFYGYIDMRPGTPHWGFFDLDEVMDRWLPSLRPEAELDLDWQPKKVKEIASILGGE